MPKQRLILAIGIPVALVLSLVFGFTVMERPASADPGNHYYINAATGNDGNDGSYGSPWKTISHAADNVPAGTSASDPNVIHVADGTYDTSLGESFPITLDNENVTLLADWTTTAPVINGGCATTILKIEDTGITIDGFTINNATYGVEADCGAFSILNNTFSNNTDWDIAYGVYVDISESDRDADFSFDPILIEGNEFNISSAGVYLHFDLDFDDT